jgi:hypothetical protein
VKRLAAALGVSVLRLLILLWAACGVLLLVGLALVLLGAAPVVGLVLVGLGAIGSVGVAMGILRERAAQQGERS